MLEDKRKEFQNNNVNSDSGNNNYDKVKIMNEQNIIVPAYICENVAEYKKCVCKLQFLKNNSAFTGTGFFCYIPSKNIRVFITNNHVIDQEFLNKEKELRIYYEEKREEKEKVIDLRIKRVKYTNATLDVTVIEILDEDLIDEFFEVDEEFIKNKEFLGESVYNLQFPKGDNLKASFGKIKSKKCDYKFVYDAGSESGSSGSPILSVEGNKLIGFHRGCLPEGSSNYDKKKNLGTYFDKIIELIPKSSQPENKNVIKCLYNINEENENQDVQIFNNINNIDEKITEINIFKEDDIKKKLYNGQCRFEKKGKYFIQYHLDSSATDLSDMFNNCTSLIKVYMPSLKDNKIKSMKNMFLKCSSLREINYLPSLNTKDVIDMSNLFSACSSLKKINLSSFNTENVEDMSDLFRECNSLVEVNLTSFNTKNVENMSSMFAECENLREIDLSKFNTEKVIFMTKMFCGCRKLRKINLNSFNPENVIDLSKIFENCISLQKLDLSTFHIPKICAMKEMFKGCISLKEINLSSFKINNFVKINNMFEGCSSLQIIASCSDNRILKEYEKCKGKRNIDNNEYVIDNYSN